MSVEGDGLHSQPTTSVRIELDEDCIHAENIGEFYPAAVEAGRRFIETFADPGSRESRDAGVIAACVLEVGLRALIAEHGEPTAVVAGRSEAETSNPSEASS